MAQQHNPHAAGAPLDLYALECGERVLERAKQVSRKIVDMVKQLSGDTATFSLPPQTTDETTVHPPLPPT